MSALRAIPNPEIADVLERVADLLEAQEANRYRVAAYRRAAATARAHGESLVELYDRGGVEALDALPSIGPTIAAHVAELAHRGGLTLLDRLEGEVSPERLFGTIAGLGPELARRVHQDLGVESLEELERAAHDGRLARVAGFGPRRVRAVREQLASILGRSARHRARRRAWLEARDGAQQAPPRPAIATLLAADAEYRDGAARGRLRRVAPRRFNPDREAWLPILHTERDRWQITALFSNTARAHELGRTRDWVVLFYERDGDSGQCTVVTETHGPQAGQRVVRGRESEGGKLQDAVAQSDPWVERLARLFREHPAWREAARFIDPRATSNVFLTHRPGEAWHLERRGNEVLLLPGAASDPDFVFHFAPGAIARLEAVRGEAGDFAAELFMLAMTDDCENRVDLRIAGSFSRLLRRGYVRLLLAAGPRVRAMGLAHGVVDLESLVRLVTRLRDSTPRAWENQAQDACRQAIR